MLGIHRMKTTGTAKVVSCNLKTGAFAITKTNSKGQSTTAYVLILDVYPDGAPPFRAETHKMFSAWRKPKVGDSLKVRCNPEKHKVEVDLTDDGRFNPKIYRAENKRQAEEEHERRLNAAPGTPAPEARWDDPIKPFE